ncbi:hypothetical protein PENSPDRAFT_694947 [Peniophora sp. CONT]|nr:hypothetical protein PENSPDRAFT_694947 [Peniophora sp. CONT]
MPYVDPSNYPADIPEGGFHLDVDDADDFRLPVGLDTDVFLYQTAPRGRDPGTQGPAAAPAGTPAAAPAAPRPQAVRVPLPQSFSGVPTKEGMYEPAPCDFSLSVALYLRHQQIEMREIFTNDRKIHIFTGFLEQSVARWYNQLLLERNRQSQGPLAYQGPLRSMDALADKFLNDYEDINIRATAKHKIKTLTQGSNSAEAHVRFFKEWADLSGYDQDALIDWFKLGLKVALKDKVSNQGKNRPTTLEDWYEDAMYFDRQYREDQLEKSMSRGGNNANNNLSGSRANAQQQQQPQQPRNVNQWAPLTNNGQFRPWGSIAQPAQQQQQPRQPYRGPAPMDVDTMTMYTPRATQNRSTNFANVGEYLNAMSQEQREELAHALQTGGAQGANQAPQVPAPQGFANGLS